MSRVPFITVEGPIGVGKTSLAKVVSDYFQYELLKEIVDENPFWVNFTKTLKSGASKRRCFSMQPLQTTRRCRKKF